MVCNILYAFIYNFSNTVLKITIDITAMVKVVYRLLVMMSIISHNNQPFS